MARSKPSIVEILDDVTEAIRSGEAVRLRVDARLSRPQAAQPMEVTEGALRRWERGERLPRGRNLKAYHKLLTDLRSRAAERVGGAA
jgi:DNA-binding transcriptional regulator YiaG